LVVKRPTPKRDYSGFSYDVELKQVFPWTNFERNCPKSNINLILRLCVGPTVYDPY